MDTESKEDAIATRRGGRLALVIGALAVGAGFWFFASGRAEVGTGEIRISPGFAGTTTALVAEALAAEVRAHGGACRVIETGSTQREVEALESGAAEFALVPGVYRVDELPDVKLVTPLYVEALHLLVRGELAASVTPDLAGLRGRRVDLGPAGSATEGLATEGLRFAGVPIGGAGGVSSAHLDIPELRRLIDAGDTAALPDAIFHLATVPSLIAQDLVQSAGYALIALPFAEAFRLNAVIADETGRGAEAHVDRRRVIEVKVPAFLYQTHPAVPAAAMPTLGTRLQLVARSDTPADAIDRMLAAIFESAFAHLFHPSLEHDTLARASRRHLHPAAVEFLERREPAITQDTVDELSNSLSVLGALGGGALFLVQGLRQRRRAQRDAVIARYLQRVADAERRIVEIELAADLAIEPLMTLQRELLELKREALGYFTSGALEEASALSDLLEPVNAARVHVGDLLLHARDQLQASPPTERAEARSAWEDAAERSAEHVEREAEDQAGGATTT